MFKKFLAGLTAIVLSLGMVALTAGPASAHQNTISVSVSCDTGTEGYWKVTWSVTNSESNKTETITSSTDPSLVPVGTVIGAGATSTFIEYYAAKPTANKTLTLGAQWSNGATNIDGETLKKNQFSDDCLPDTTDHKVWICHANNGNGTGGFVKNEVDIDSIIKENGHAEHQNGRDIIPPFDYVKQGQEGSFAGLNWNPPYSQAFINAGCQEPTATPAVPTFTEANCPAPGQVGQASYVIPFTTGIKYTVQLNGAGGFVEQGANTYFVPAGTKVEVQAVALTDYVLGTPNYWSTTFQNKDCIVTVTPNPATFSVLECIAGEATQPSYTIPTTDGVKYTVQINGVGGFVEKSANTYNVAQGTTVEVKAVALTGYSLVGDEQWSKTFAVIDCDIAVPVQPIVASDQECVIDDLDTGAAHYEPGTITIPNTLHVTYSVNGVAKGAGEHDYAPGTYTMSAVADLGYKLSGVPDPWTVTIKADEPCGQLIVLPVVDPVVTFVQITCSESGSYTLAVEPVEESAGVIWTVSGGLPNTLGTHSVTTAGTVTITATPAPGYGFTNDQDGFIEWSFDFTTLPDDCLPTLALTGGSMAAGGLGLGALLTLGGILVFNARKRDLAVNSE